MGALVDSQRRFARHLRDPDGEPPPEGVSDRRLQIYRELVYRNIEGFIAGGFPVLRRLLSDDEWHALVRGFVRGHRCTTPYFLRIAEEFLAFLQSREASGWEPPYLVQLAHYEWIELALDVAEAEVPAAQSARISLDSVPTLSPLARLLTYDFPVHRVGPGNPDVEPATTCLMAFRDRADVVRFMELNAATARLLDYTQGNTSLSVRAILAQLGAELGIDPSAVGDFALQQLAELNAAGAITMRTDE